jgi:hypothetical protein
MIEKAIRERMQIPANANKRSPSSQNQTRNEEQKIEINYSLR